MKSQRKMIRELDAKIILLMGELDKEGLNILDKRVLSEEIDTLVEIRIKLYDSQQKGSIKHTVVSGVFGFMAVLTVLHYEKLNVITSKMLNYSLRMIEG